MRVNKKKAYALAQNNVFKRAKMKDKAENNYAKSIEKLRIAEGKLSKEELIEVQQEVPVKQENITYTGNLNSIVFSEAAPTFTT